MDKLDILERYYNAFINLDNSRDFFIGMADYLEFLDSVPEFDRITADIVAQRKPLEEKLEALKKTALEKLAKVHDELLAYISKHEIENEEIKRLFEQEYDGWISGKIAGSSSLPVALHDALGDIIILLYRIPEHKDFASKYMEFSERDPNAIRHYLSIQECTDFNELEQEIKRKRETELWGILEHISWLYETVKRGREKHKALVEEHKKTRSSRASFDILNYSVLVGEWVKIEEEKQYGIPNHARPVFFDVKKVRPWLVRLHNHIVARYVLGNAINQAVKVITTTESKPMPSTFKPRLILENGVGYLQIFKQTKKHTIGGINTRKFKLLKCLFSPENTIEASYSPTLQGQERVFEAIRLPKDKRNSKLQSVATMQTERRSIIEAAIDELQKIKSLKGHLTFTRDGDKIRIDITLPEGNNNLA